MSNQVKVVITETTKATAGLQKVLAGLAKQAAELTQLGDLIPDLATEIGLKQTELSTLEEGLALAVRQNAANLNLLVLENEAKVLKDLMRNQNLAQIKQKPFHEPKDIGDEWRTPRALALGIEAECGPFSYDLFTDSEINARFPRFLTNGQNALVIDWCALASDDDVPATGFANPPYSRSEKDNMGEYLKGLKACMEKAYDEMQSGFKSVWLVPSATGAGWFPRHTATSIWYLEGRVTFEVPEWYNQDPDAPYPSSARGDSVIVIFDPNHVGKQTTRYPKTRDLIKRGEEIIEARVSVAQATGNTVVQVPANK